MTARSFWTRICVAAILLNLPLALAVVMLGLPAPIAAFLSAGAGMATLMVVDRQRAASGLETADDRVYAPDMQLTISTRDRSDAHEWVSTGGSA